MGLRSWMSEDWFRSPRAAQLFGLGVAATFIMTPFLFGYPVDANTAPLPIRIVVVASVLGASLIWLGMWRFWLRFDHSEVSVKRGWFLLLFVGFWWSSCLYYFFVYLPQVRRTQRYSS